MLKLKDSSVKNENNNVFSHICSDFLSCEKHKNSAFFHTVKEDWSHFKSSQNLFIFSQYT